MKSHEIVATGYIETMHHHFRPHNHHPHFLLIMHKLSSDQVLHILHLLDKGMSAALVHSQTGYDLSTISHIPKQHRPSLAKPSGGRPRLLSITNLNYAKGVIQTGKVNTATDAAGLLRSHSHKSFSTQTLRSGLK